MTLFQTLPQFTMFVLFFMLGFVTRFFAQITIFVCGITCGAIGKQVIFAYKKFILWCRKTYNKNISEKLACKQVKIKKAFKRKKTINKEARQDDKAKLNVVARQQESPKSKNKENLSNHMGKLKIHIKKIKLQVAWLEVIYFITLGILTLKTYSLFEFVDYFWFIPVAVIMGVVINDYLTKEVFAKRKKL